MTSEKRITSAGLPLLLACLATGTGWLVCSGALAFPGTGEVGQDSPHGQANLRPADHNLSSILGKLDPSHIAAEKRSSWQPPELVSVLGDHRGRMWGGVKCVAFSPYGKLIGSCGWYDFAVRLWDAQTLQARAARSSPAGEGGTRRTDREVR